MKAITLTQPWATLVAIGAKAIETRTWRTSHRGPIAIHAAQGFPRWARAQCLTERFASVLEARGYDSARDLPTGAIVAIATVQDCVRIGGPGFDLPPEPERSFGDYARGRWAWLLADVLELGEPLPCDGARRVWTLPPDVAERLLATSREDR